MISDKKPLSKEQQKLVALAKRLQKLQNQKEQPGAISYTFLSTFLNT
jgi:uncharacterized coiled-coil protein SlyX